MSNDISFANHRHKNLILGQPYLQYIVNEDFMLLRFFPEFPDRKRYVTVL